MVRKHSGVEIFETQMQIGSVTHISAILDSIIRVQNSEGDYIPINRSLTAGKRNFESGAPNGGRIKCLSRKGDRQD